MFLGQCLVQDIDSLRGVELLVVGHSTIGALLMRSGPDFFNVFQKMHRFGLQATHAVNNAGHLPWLCVLSE
jgi:hypothetical protein